jgi:predicted Zn finger-like uncharacterized protein
MFTQCPDCRKTYPVTKKQLRGKKAKYYCSDCKKKFNPLLLLNEKSPALISEVKAEYRSTDKGSQVSKGAASSEINSFSTDISGFLRHRILNTESANVSELDLESEVERFPWEVEKTPLAINWMVGFILGCLLLFAQLIYFEADNISQNIVYRPKIEKIASLFGYELTIYENLHEFEVLQGSLNPDDNGVYWFKATISNQAAFKQRLPNIKLALLDFNEEIFSERIFTPEEYLSYLKRSSFFITPDETIQASLKISPPKTTIGGYHFDLLY